MKTIKYFITFHISSSKFFCFDSTMAYEIFIINTYANPNVFNGFSYNIPYKFLFVFLELT